MKMKGPLRSRSPAGPVTRTMRADGRRPALPHRFVDRQDERHVGQAQRHRRDELTAFRFCADRNQSVSLLIFVLFARCRVRRHHEPFEAEAFRPHELQLLRSGLPPRKQAQTSLRSRVHGSSKAANNSRIAIAARSVQGASVGGNHTMSSIYHL